MPCNPEKSLIVVNCETLFEVFSGSGRVRSFIEPRLNIYRFEKLLLQERTMFGDKRRSFGKLREALIECAKDEFAVVAYDFFTLKTIVKSLGEDFKESLLNFPLLIQTFL